MKTHLHLIALLVCSVLVVIVHAQTGNWKLAGNSLAGTEVLGSTNNFDLKFITNNTQRMLLTKSGRLRIGSSFGTVAPTTLFQVGGRVIITDNPSMVSEPVLELSTFNNNCVQWYKIFDTLKAVVGFDQSTNDFVISTQNAGISPDFIINRGNGYIGLGTKTPATKLHVIGEETLQGDLTMQSGTGQGDINFTYYQQAIRFPNPNADSTENAAMIYMTVSPTSGKRMVLAHSESFKNWGLQYNDAIDQFNFLGAGNNRMAINLANGFVGISNASPSYKLDVSGNSRIVGNLGVQTAPNSRTIQCGSTQGALLGIGTAEYIQDAGINALSFNENVIPVSDNTWTLGNSSNRWFSVWAVDGTINTSDVRDKSNIRDLNYGLKEIMKLRPVKFNWKNNPAEGDKLGVVAQEIQKVLPEVVRDWEYQIDEKTGQKTKVSTEKLGVMYADIIPVLIRSIQELKQEIDQLKQVQTGVTSSAVALSNTALSQNAPNPVKTATVIQYSINNDAQLIIKDQNGKTVKQFPVKGNGSVTVDCAALSAGIYTYTLLSDNKIVDSKKMMVTK